MFSQTNDIKHIELNFPSVAWIMPQGWDLECWGGVNNLVWGFVMVPYRLGVLLKQEGQGDYSFGVWHNFKIFCMLDWPDDFSKQ